jgi:hypothetical protein
MITNTSCKFCVFKETVFNQKENKLQQVGCKLGRLGKFEENGGKLEYVKDNIDHYVIKKRFCMALRQEQWAKKQNNPIEAVREEIALQCDLIIMDVHSLRNLDNTIISITNQKLKPKNVSVVLTNTNIKPLDVFDMLGEHLNGYNINYFVEDIADKKYPYNKALDVAADKCESTYYAVFNAGFKIPPSFLSDIDYAINDRLERFSVLKPLSDGNGLVVQSKLHKFFLGNREIELEKYEDGALIGSNMIDKVEFLADKQKNSYLVKQVTDICNFQS